MYLAAVTWSTWLANCVMEGYAKAHRVCTDVYRLYTQEHVYYIADNGQFVDASFYDINNKSQFWFFDGKTLVNNRANAVDKRLQYLSCEMRLDNTVVSMDDFFEQVRYAGAVPPPFAVVMAAFMITKKAVYAWSDARFKVFLRNGEEKEFTGQPPQ